MLQYYSKVNTQLAKRTTKLQVTDTQSLGQRIYSIRLLLGEPPRRPMSLEEFGKRVAKAVGRDKPYSIGMVRLWEVGESEPALPVLKAIAAMDPEERGEYWLVLGGEPRHVTAAKRPPRS